MIERDVKTAVKRMLNEFGAYYYMLVPTGYGRRGVPDFLVCYRGRFLAVETKAGNNKATPHQEKEMEQIRSAGGSTLVINEENTGLLRDWLRRVGAGKL